MNLVPDAMPIERSNEPPPWIAAQETQIPHPTVAAVKTVDMGLAKVVFDLKSIVQD